ncbi:MAG: thioredoxin [Bacteroidetes bacterium]|jgi:thioredoxin 1|nr:thioredoxin [Bacteroidota bacterium]MDF1865165.1 thioredoxin [Saprospiraceae bacterium]
MQKKVSFNELINSEKPVLVDFYADWCGPCQAMSPILKEVAGNLKDKASIIKIDVDKNQAVSMKYGVRGIPTFILFQNGEVKWRHSGMTSAFQLEKIINENSKTTST